jgi:hypothetical protein
VKVPKNQTGFHNRGTLTASDEQRAIATLWQLAMKDDRLFCTVYRTGDGLQLRLESASALILSEPFDFQPRMLARTRMLRNSLKRRGWEEVS